MAVEASAPSLETLREAIDRGDPEALARILEEAPAIANARIR